MTSHLLFSPNRSFRRQVLLLALIPLLLSLLGAVLVHQAMQQMDEMESQVDDSTLSILLGEELIGTVLSAQTGIRGYVLAGEERFLAPYDEAIERFDRLVGQGRLAWADDPEKLERLEEVSDLFARYREEITEPLLAMARPSRLQSQGLGQDDGVSAWIDQAIAGGRDKDLVDQMKSNIREMIDRERAELNQQMRIGERRRVAAFVAGVAGPPVAVLIVILLLGILLRRIALGLETLQDGVGRIEGGDLSGRIELDDNRELHRVAAGFNRMAERLQFRQEQGRQLDRLSRALQGCESLEEVYSVSTGYLTRILPRVRGTVSVYRHSRDLVEPQVSWGEERSAVVIERGFEPRECWALRSGSSYHCKPDAGDPPCSHFEGAREAETFCVPMYSGDEVLGVVSLGSAQGTGLGVGYRTGASVMAEKLAYCIANLQLRQALRDQSIRDPLTGLYNRRFLDETLGRELARAQRMEQPLSVIVLDADHFKRFNDTWGHDAGDEVLMAIAGLLQEAARDVDIVCRMGGEEFLVVLPRSGASEAVGVAERFRETAERMQLSHAGRPLARITLSFGVAVFPEHGRNAKSLLAAADTALYQAKNAGRNRVEVAAGASTG